MKRKRETEEQIISILSEHQAGANGPYLSRPNGVAAHRIYRRKTRFGDVGLSEAKRLREIDQENARLKRLLAGVELDDLAMEQDVEGRW